MLCDGRCHTVVMSPAKTTHSWSSDDLPTPTARHRGRNGGCPREAVLVRSTEDRSARRPSAIKYMPAQPQVQRPASALRYEHHVLFARPCRVTQTPQFVRRDSSFRVLGGSRSAVSLMDTPSNVKLLLSPRQSRGPPVVASRARPLRPGSAALGWRRRCSSSLCRSGMLRDIRRW